MIHFLVLLLAMLMCGGANGQTWVQRYDDIDGEAENDQTGTAVAMSGDGTTLVVGATNHDTNGDNAGRVRVFRDDGTAWSQLGDDIDGEAAGDLSVIVCFEIFLSRRSQHIAHHKQGFAVAVSDDGMTIAIGAPYNAGNGSNSGHVRVYRFDDAADEWILRGADIDGETADDRSVSINTAAAAL
jgi:hypothetical protein